MTNQPPPQRPQPQWNPNGASQQPNLPQWNPNMGPQQPPYPPLAPPQPVFKPTPKKGHKGLFITGGVIALLLVAGTVNAANKPSAGSPQVVVATTSAPAVSTAPTTTAPATTAPATTAPATTQAPPPPATTEAPALPVSQQQAVKSAEDYLDTMAFSRTGLIKQLEFEGFSAADATYAVDHVTVDWNAQADASAKEYMDMGGFSHKSLLAQLVFEGFTAAQAAHGVKSVGL